MRTSKFLGVVCAGWIALSMGAPHAGATTSDGSESSHRAYSAPSVLRNFELPSIPGLPGFDKGDPKDRGGHDGCDNQCDQKDRGGDSWNSGDNHKRDGCDKCDHESDHQQG